MASETQAGAGEAPARGRALLLEALSLHRRDVLLSLGAGVAWSMTRLGTPYFVRRGIDIGIGTRDSAQLVRAVVGVAVLGGLGALFAGYRRYWAQAGAARVETTLRARLLRHLLCLDLGFHTRWPAGKLVSRAASDLQQIHQPLVNVPVTASNTIMFIGAAFVLLRMDPGLALVALGPTLFIFVFARLCTVRLGLCARQLQQALAVVASKVEESIAGIRSIKGLGLEHVECGRVEQQTEQVYQAGLRMNRVRALYLPLIEFLPALGLAGVIWLGSERVAQGTLSIGALVQFYYYVVMMIGPLRMVGITLAQLERAVASADLIAALLDTAPAIADCAVPESLPAARRYEVGAELRFEDVQFAYPGQPALLRGLSLHVRAGETVALVGTTGAGKSSLALLIARLFDVQGGRITLDGVDLRQLSLRELRAELGVVFEDAFLFHGTVRDNIAFGAENASAEQIEQAARAAGAHDFIVALAGGYDASVGERGLSLSGGQRQRVALARALLREPRILILDAATTAVDAATEETMRGALAATLRGRTTFLIDNRAATLRLADRVLLLDGGRIVDAGTHDALLARSARYRAILALARGPGAPARARHELMARESA